VVHDTPDQYDEAMVKKTIALVLGLTTIAAAAIAADSSKGEAQIWSLEKDYWEYVKANDLEKYRALWHEDFVGWPLVNSEPVRKDRITDWMKGNTSRGLKLQSYLIEHLAVKITGDVAIDHYRIKLNWARIDNGEATRTDGLRITHTWVRTGDTWQILGGMSAPVNSDGK